MSDELQLPWSDREFAAYQLGMQTEREHQNALSEWLMEDADAPAPGIAGLVDDYELMTGLAGSLGGVEL